MLTLGAIKLLQEMTLIEQSEIDACRHSVSFTKWFLQKPSRVIIYQFYASERAKDLSEPEESFL